MTTLTGPGTVNSGDGPRATGGVPLAGLLSLAVVTFASAEQPIQQVPRKATPSGRLSTSWHPLVRRVAQCEAFVGNSRLEVGEVSLLLRMLDARHGLSQTNAERMQESFWKLVVSMPLSSCVDDSLFAELVRRARSHLSVAHAQLFLACHAPQHAKATPAAREVVALAQSLRSGKTPDIGRAAMKYEIPYLLLCSKQMPSARVLAGILRSYPELVAYAADACTLSPATDIYAEVLAEAVSSSPTTHARSCMAYYLAHAVPKGWESMMRRLEDTIPHTSAAGHKEFVLSSATGDMGVLQAIWNARDTIGLVQLYREARAQNRISQFLSHPAKNIDLARYKSWILYMYCPDIFPSLLGQYGDCTTLAATNGVSRYLMWLLSGVLMHSSLLPGHIDRESVRRLVCVSQDPIGKANALYLLKLVASDQDIGLLLTLARDPSVLRWEADGRSYSVPLVAVLAVSCLKEIASDRAKEALHEVESGERFPTEARSAARKTLAQFERVRE